MPEQHAAGEDAGVDQRAADVDRAVHLPVVVEREVARVRQHAARPGVRLGLQRPDQHVVEGEDERQRAREQQREPQHAPARTRPGLRLRPRDGDRERLGGHHARSSSSRRLSSESSSTTATSMSPIAAATSGCPCSMPRRYISSTGVVEAPSGPPPPVSRYGSVNRFPPVIVARTTTSTVAGRTPGQVTAQNERHFDAPSTSAAS